MGILYGGACNRYAVILPLTETLTVILYRVEVSEVGTYHNVSIITFILAFVCWFSFFLCVSVVCLCKYLCVDSGGGEWMIWKSLILILFSFLFVSDISFINGNWMKLYKTQTFFSNFRLVFYVYTDRTWQFDIYTHGMSHFQGVVNKIWLCYHFVEWITRCRDDISDCILHLSNQISKL